MKINRGSKTEKECSEIAGKRGKVIETKNKHAVGSTGMYRKFLGFKSRKIF